MSFGTPSDLGVYLFRARPVELRTRVNRQELATLLPKDIFG